MIVIVVVGCFKEEGERQRNSKKKNKKEHLNKIIKRKKEFEMFGTL